jgi:hypothetical protein
VKRALYRLGTWGDRRHWELFAWRFQVVRWCSGAPCHLEGVQSRHGVQVSYRRQRY